MTTPPSPAPAAGVTPPSPPPPSAPAPEQTDEAMKCPHPLAELVFDLATGCTGGSTRVGICR